MEIRWRDSLIIGIPQIDKQHQELIEALNALGDAMREGKGKDEIEKMLDFASRYAQDHFRSEEACFERYQCPAAEINKRDHKQFAEKFIELQQEFHEKGSSFALVLKIHNEFSNWLLQHIWQVDMKLRPYVQED